MSDVPDTSRSVGKCVHIIPIAALPATTLPSKARHRAPNGILITRHSALFGVSPFKPRIDRDVRVCLKAATCSVPDVMPEVARQPGSLHVHV
jgi:hypothetical protein